MKFWLQIFGLITLIIVWLGLAIGFLAASETWKGRLAGAILGLSLLATWTWLIFR